MENKIDYQKEALKHFRLSIIDAKLAYTLFKSLYQSRDKEFVGEELFEKYFWTQKQHNIFVQIEHNAVSVFIIKILHGFDNDRRSLTLRDIDEKAYKDFVDDTKNKKVLEKIKTLRDKTIAHYDKDQNRKNELPLFSDIDLFFERLQTFYNDVSKKVEDSVTLFGQDEDLKRELEKMLMNLYVGEKIRLLNIDVEWKWDKNPKKISGK